MADYFSRHVVFYPRLAMVNQHTDMPNRHLGVGQNSISPMRHDRHIQMWPILYHYTGWPDIKMRYDTFDEAAEKSYVREWFLQTGEWEQKTAGKKSRQPPDPITDLSAVRASREGIELHWTSPSDDSDTGRAERYFIKISNKPIIAFAPTDNTARSGEKARVVSEVEAYIADQMAGSKKRKSRYTVKPGTVRTESTQVPRANPDWHKVNAFWMAEHVADEPVPSAAGEKESFTLRKLKPHNWFGQPDPGLDILAPGTYYIAVCSWDEDRNLSKLSNVVTVNLD
jgi:hypothetical protein